MHQMPVEILRDEKCVNELPSESMDLFAAGMTPVQVSIGIFRGR